MLKRPPKVLLAKLGLDGHDRGLTLISRWLTDAGMEVIYLGANQTPDSVASAALAEDVDVIGLSFLGGEHLLRVPKMARKMKEVGLEDVALVIGGVIPRQDIAPLRELGADAVFVPGTAMETIVSYIGQKARALV